LYGAATWTARKVCQKYLESFEMWCWRMLEVSWNALVRNQEVLQNSQEGEAGPTNIKMKEGK
jgi:hypothetical protein